jgi:acetamidase/formamidase
MHAQSQRTHRLEATPATVAYGYYWSDAKPVLRIASGDIIDVDTLLTNTPAGLEKAGVPRDRIQPSLIAIVNEVTGDRRGPGGHILTGPVYVEGAQPGDVLEVKVLSIDSRSITATTAAPDSFRRTAIVPSAEDSRARSQGDDVRIQAGAS